MLNERSKVFQDATQGYISVENVYVENLIDTEYMQREKSVSQVGLRSIFSGANHDRFSHSMGVYNVGKQIFSAFRKSVMQYVDECQSKTYIELLDQYEVLFYIACFLHDIGHPAFSHTLEYIYNDDYIYLFSDKSQDLKGYVEHLVKRYIDLKKNEREDVYLKTQFVRELIQKECGDYGNEVHAAPHELMGAYQILTVKKLEEAICQVLTQKNFNGEQLYNQYISFIARMITGCRYDLGKVGNLQNDSQEEINIKTICSLRNCIIALLNGKFDADSIDYLNRNAHFAGYATNNIDINRLCAAFSVHCKDGIFTVCIAKSALSSLDGVIQARNFEPKWLYSHHKVAYFNEVLIKYLMKMSGEYLFFAHQRKIEKLVLSRKNIMKLFALADHNAQYLYDLFDEYNEQNSHNDIDVKNIDKWFQLNISDATKRKLQDLKASCELVKEYKHVRYAIWHLEAYLFSVIEKLILLEEKYEAKIITISDCIININNMFSQFKYAFISAILSPMNPLKIETSGHPRYVFYKTTDSGIEKLLNDIRESHIMPIENVNIADVTWQFRCSMYNDMLEEYSTRKYRSSLWKSYEEYVLFMKRVIRNTSFTFESAHNAFMELILKACHSSCFMEFENINTAKASQNDQKKYEAIYVNNYENEIAEILMDYQKIFGFLGKGMIIRFYQCKYKSFDDLAIKFDKDICVKMSEINLNKANKSFWFPYIYYKESDHVHSVPVSEKVESTEIRNQLLEKLESKLRTYLATCCGKERAMDIENINFLDGKVIRDSVHGDIFVENKFLKLIESRAFQRLHRIRQLATANHVFPEAVHTRFAHSLGTFHVMKKILEHFCSVFKQLGLDYKEREKDVVLAAALLHDIGHGPLSHVFESVRGNCKTHEEWTREIIMYDSELRDIMTEQFDPSFAQDVSDCLQHSCTNPCSLQYVFSELISSNLDADRIDYLMRDSLNTGEKFGVLDMQKLISSMMLTEYNGRLRIAVGVNALSAVEQFIVGRFNMYLMVYFAPYKVLSEKLFEYICEEIVSKANVYANSTDNKEVYEAAKKLQSLSICRFASGQSTLAEYLQMDDYTIMNDLMSGAKILESIGDKLCATLLDCFLYRRGYKRKHILNDSASDYDRFCNRLSKEYPLDKLKYSIITAQRQYNAYTGGDDQELLVIYDNGEIKPFSESSKFLDDKKDKSKLWDTHYVAMYLNREILNEECKALNNGDLNMAEQLEQLIDTYDLVRHTEIENKYTVSQEEATKAIEVLSGDNLLELYSVEGKPVTKSQKDTYFDTKEYVLAKNGYAIRCREVAGKYIFTLKKPGNVGKSKDETQFIRLEFEMESETNQMTASVVDFLDKNNLAIELQNVKGIKDFSYTDLRSVVQIENNRTSCFVKHGSIPKFKCEVSIDDVTYKQANTLAHDYQVEIELKCSYIYRVNLNDFADRFCKMIGIQAPNDKKSKFSKYITALQKLHLCE